MTIKVRMSHSPGVLQNHVVLISSLWHPCFAALFDEDCRLPLPSSCPYVVCNKGHKVAAICLSNKLVWFRQTLGTLPRKITCLYLKQSMELLDGMKVW